MGIRNAISGHDLHAEFEETVADIERRTQERSTVVAERLATLEEEHSVLRNLASRIGLIRKP